MCMEEGFDIGLICMFEMVVIGLNLMVGELYD